MVFGKRLTLPFVLPIKKINFKSEVSNLGALEIQILYKDTMNFIKITDLISNFQRVSVKKKTKH